MHMLHAYYAYVFREGAQNANDFAWQMQLRYSWNEALDDVVVRQVNARYSPQLSQIHCNPLVFYTLQSPKHLKSYES